MEKDTMTQKQGEVNLLFKLIPTEASKIRTKKELLKRLDHIQELLDTRILRR